jgi:membrane protein implicated in regulation of membrane protease activity
VNCLSSAARIALAVAVALGAATALLALAAALLFLLALPAAALLLLLALPAPALLVLLTLAVAVILVLILVGHDWFLFISFTQAGAPPPAGNERPRRGRVPPGNKAQRGQLQPMASSWSTQHGYR